MPRRSRVLVACAIAALTLVVGAWIAIHVIVSTGTLRRWVNTNPESLTLDYDSASAWVPGLIRVRGLSMRGSDRNVQWFFRADEATVTVSLLELLQKRFHATRVRTTGLVFRLRERAEKRSLSAAHLARLPKIPGFADPPLTTDEAEPPPPSRAEIRRLWTVHVENFAADPATDIWIEIYRFQGHARVTGSFEIRPHVQARVGPAAVDFMSGSLALAPGDPILTSASGHADCRIESYAPEEVVGVQVWPKISGTIRLGGRLEDLRFVNHFVRRSPEPRFSGGGGPASVALTFRRGIGQGHAEFRADTFAASYGDRSLTGRAEGRLEIPRWDVQHDDMEIAGSRLVLADVRTAGTRHDETGWWGRFDFVTGRINGDFAAGTTVACRDARPLYTAFRTSLPDWAQGILKLEHLRGRASVRLGRDLVDVRDLEAEGGNFRIEGFYVEKKDGRQGAFLVEKGLLSVGVSVDGSASRVKPFGGRKWLRQKIAAAGAAS